MPLTYQRFRNNSQLENAANNSPALTWGAHGTGVAEVQRALVALGFSMPKSTRPNGDMDGFYGDETFSAVWDFQEQKKTLAKQALNLNLAVDGVAGKDTLATLDRIMTNRSLPAPKPPEPRASVQIVGNTTFVTKIFEAVQLLQTRADAYKTLVENVDIIRFSMPSGMDAANRHPTINIAQPTFERTLTWLASVLAHESYHSVLYHAGKEWATIDADKICNHYQLKVLKQIGGSAYDISYLRGLDGTHCDLNHDGVCDRKDYVKRDW